MTDFKVCAAKLASSPFYADKYGWHGDVRFVPRNSSSQISLPGCRELCGTTPDYYDWDQVSNTILTWILPVLGILLQAPFESNANLANVRVIARWLGSPMASIANILWNIKVSSKCALIVDMANGYRDAQPEDDSAFAGIRDSFCILMNMNQYDMRASGENQKNAETLLRSVLFRDDLTLQTVPPRPIGEVRSKLAGKLRKARKGGVVAVFITTGWFIFSFAVSIQNAFGSLGDNATAHDLALGLLLSWIPILILLTIVDRNPIASDDVMLKMNKLIDLAIDAMAENGDDPAGEYHQMKGFFTGFAAQGRVRFHYGCAQPILRDLEQSFLAKSGRGWLEPEAAARSKLISSGDIPRGLLFFDFRELVQIIAALGIVGITTAGAFCLSYYAPTIGIGCRTMGYLIFTSISTLLVLVEFGAWILSTKKWFIDGVLAKPWFREPSWWLVHRKKRAKYNIAYFLTRYLLRRRSDADAMDPSYRRPSDVLLFRDLIALPLHALEALNAAVLLLIVSCQVFGIYNNCFCKSSSFSQGGGYIEFGTFNATNLDITFQSWVASTLISGAVLALSVAYIVAEWLLQSHLNSSNPHKAWRGLRRTRRFRAATLLPFRVAYRALERRVLACINVSFRKGADVWDPQRIRWSKASGGSREGSRQGSREGHPRDANAAGVGDDGAGRRVPEMRMNGVPMHEVAIVGETGDLVAGRKEEMAEVRVRDDRASSNASRGSDTYPGC